MEEIIGSCTVLSRQMEPFMSVDRVLHRADEVIKKLLHLASTTVTHRAGRELKRYYHKKVAEGKNKMTLIHALRATIVVRMWLGSKQMRYTNLV